MPENRLIRPVRAAVHGLGKYRAHNSLIDIAESLLERWPEEHYNREAHRHAQLILIECFRGKQPAEDARDAFILALDEAGISIMLEDREPRYPVVPREQTIVVAKEIKPSRRRRAPMDGGTSRES